MLKTLGDFQVDLSTPLGSGGAGTIYKGCQPSLNKRPVAIKILNKNIAGRYSEDDINRFKREIEALSQLTSGQIVHIYGAGFEENEQIIWYAMELIKAKTLDDVIFEQELSYEDIIKISTGIVEALQTALEVNIIHRDIKPSNIFVLPDKSIKLADFGLAKNPETSSLTSPDTVIGTLDYIAPERIEGTKETFKSDIYSLGAIMYEMAAKSPPFGNNLSAPELLYKHVHETPEDLAISSPEIPKSLKGIISECLEKDPSKRPGNYSEIISRLQNVKRRFHAPTKTYKSLLPHLIIYPILLFFASYVLFSLLYTPDNNEERLNEILHAPDMDSIERILNTDNIVHYDDTEATSRLANKLYTNGDYLKAMILYYDLLDRNPDNSIYKQRLVHTLLSDNRFEDILSNPLLNDYHHMAKIISNIDLLLSNRPTLPRMLKYVSTLIKYGDNEHTLTHYFHKAAAKVLLYCDDVKLNFLKSKYGQFITDLVNNNDKTNPVNKLVESENRPGSAPQKNIKTDSTKASEKVFNPYKTIEAEKKVEFLADESIKGSYFAVISLPPEQYSIVKGGNSQQLILNKPSMITYDKIVVFIRPEPQEKPQIHCGYEQIHRLESLPMINGVTPYLSITDSNGITSLRLNTGNNNKKITKHTLLDIYKDKKKVATILKYSGLSETNHAFLALNSKIFNLAKGIKDSSLKLKIIPEHQEPGRDIELHIENIQNHYDTLKLCRLSYEPKFFRITQQTNVQFPLLVEFVKRDSIVIPGKSGNWVGRGRVSVELE